MHSTDGTQVVSKITRERVKKTLSHAAMKKQTLIFFGHVLNAAKKHQKVMIRPVNKDVFILAVSQMREFLGKKFSLLLAQES